MLNNKQKSFLRGLANKLRADVIIGKDGLSEQVIESCDLALEAHELLKISMLKTTNLEVKEVAIELAINTKADIVQTIGRTVVLYRKGKEPKISLPK